MKQTILIAGKELPCRVTMGAMVRFENLTGHDVRKMDNGKMSELVAFIFCCVAAACNADGVPFTMDQQTFADHLEPSAIEDFNSLTAESGEKKAKSKPTKAPE